MGEPALETPDLSIAKIPSALLEAPPVEALDSVAKFEVSQTLDALKPSELLAVKSVKLFIAYPRSRWIPSPSSRSGRP